MASFDLVLKLSHCVKLRLTPDRRSVRSVSHNSPPLTCPRFQDNSLENSSLEERQTKFHEH